MDGVWFVKMGRGINGKCVVCMGDGVETRSRWHTMEQMGNWNDEVRWDMMN